VSSSVMRCHVALVRTDVSEEEDLRVFTAVTMKQIVFCDVLSCGSCRNRRFGGTRFEVFHGGHYEECRVLGCDAV
jgi:hypothetical protein